MLQMMLFIEDGKGGEKRWVIGYQRAIFLQISGVWRLKSGRGDDRLCGKVEREMHLLT